VGVTEVDRHSGVDGELGVLAHLLAMIPVKVRTRLVGSFWIFWAITSRTVSARRLSGRAKSITKRLVLSTITPIWEFPSRRPMMRSPSQ
jgi:hypothetical protein